MFQFSRKRVIVIVVLTCLLLITLEQRGSGTLGGVRSAFALLLRPFETAVRVVAMPVERAWNGIVNYDDVAAENEVLRDQVERMKGADIEARSAILEYQELLRLNQLTTKFAYGTAAAQVVGGSPSNFQNTVEINIGASRGVKEGMPVIDGAGLIGRITKVFPDRSIVLLITDPEYAVSAQVLSTLREVPGATTTTVATEATTPSGIPVDELPSRATTVPSTLPGATTTSTSTATTSTTLPPTTTTIVEGVVRETGTLEGRGADQPMVLRFVDPESAFETVRVGAVVDTAGGLSSLAPQGIPIGIITGIVEQDGTSTILVEVTPSATLRRLNFVAVVLYEPNPSAVRF
ncbi:MAG: rod shape-determining protein MreC [Ilumatobacteraceae bacterium]